MERKPLKLFATKAEPGDGPWVLDLATGWVCQAWAKPTVDPETGEEREDFGIVTSGWHGPAVSVVAPGWPGLHKGLDGLAVLAHANELYGGSPEWKALVRSVEAMWKAVSVPADGRRA